MSETPTRDKARRAILSGAKRVHSGAKMVLAFLAARWWAGVGVIATLMIFLWANSDAPQTQHDQPERELNERVGAPEPVPSPPPPTRIDFSVRGEVQCPSGGDVLGRERNKRDQFVEFRAPEGAWIVTTPEGKPRVDVVSDNDGNLGAIEPFDPLPSGHFTAVRVPISCDPPNFLGANGGWMIVRLSGFYECDGPCNPG